MWSGAKTNNHPEEQNVPFIDTAFSDEMDCNLLSIQKKMNKVFLKVKG